MWPHVSINVTLSIQNLCLDSILLFNSVQLSWRAAGIMIALALLETSTLFIGHIYTYSRTFIFYKRVNSWLSSFYWKLSFCCLQQHSKYYILSTPFCGAPQQLICQLSYPFAMQTWSKFVCIYWKSIGITCNTWSVYTKNNITCHIVKHCLLESIILCD